MPGKSLKTLADQVWKNHGITLIPTFDDGIEPGSVLSRQTWSNIDRIGHLRSAIPAAELPGVDGPRACLLADFKRSHEINVDAAVSLLAPVGSAKARFKKAADVVASFDSPVTYTMDLLTLEDVVEAHQERWAKKALGQRLMDNKTRIAYQVIHGRLSFVFRGSGGAGLDLKAGPLGKLASVGLGAGWQWRNEATLESKKELVLAVDYAWYDWKKKRFKEDKR